MSPRTVATGRVSLPSRRVAAIVTGLGLAVAAIVAGVFLTGWGRHWVLEPLTTRLVVTATTDGTFVSGHASEPGYVEVAVDGHVIGSADTGRDGAFRVRAPIPDGEHTVRVESQAVLADWLRVTAVAPRLDVCVCPTSAQPPTLTSVRSVVNTEEVPVSGRTSPGSDVLITDGHTSSDVRVTANRDGTFAATYTLPKPGRYRLNAYTITDRSLRSQASSDATVEFDRRPISRSLTVTLTPTYRHLAADVTVPRDDERVTRLVNGEPIGQFLDAILSQPRIDDSDPFLQLNGTPAMTIEDDKVRVRVEWDSRIDHTSLRREVVLSGGGDFPTIDGDVFTLVLRDYHADSFRPAPSTLSGGVAVWRHDGGDAAVAAPITVGIHYDALSDPLSVTSLSWYSLLDAPVTSLLPVGFALLIALPVLWLQERRWLDQVPWLDPARSRAVDRMLGALLVVAMLAALSQLTTSGRFDLGLSAPAGWLLHRQVSIPDIAQFGLVLAALTWAQAAARLLVRRAGTYLVYVLLRAMAQAAAIACLAVGARAAASAAGHGGVTERLAFDVALVVTAAVAAYRLRDVPRRLGVPLGGLRRRVLLAIGTAAAVVVAVGWHEGVRVWDPGVADGHAVFELAEKVVPLTVGGVLVLTLRLARGGPGLPPPVLGLVAAILFSGVLIGPTVSWFLVPCSFVASAVLVSRIVDVDSERVKELLEMAGLMPQDRPRLLRQFASWSGAQSLRDAHEPLLRQVATGEVNPGEYRERKRAIDEQIERLEAEAMASQDLSARDVALAIGPCDDDWSNGLWGAGQGLVLAGPPLFLYTAAAVWQGSRDWWSLLPLWLLVQIAATVGVWWISGFFFGYFFTRIRGRSGLVKGTLVGLAMVLCLLPVWLATAGSPVYVLIDLVRASGIVLFFAVLGFWAFDYRNYRDALRSQFSWREFGRFGDARGITAAGSSLLAAVGVMVGAAVTGEAPALLAQLAKAASNGIGLQLGG